jgi:hypothetical protein
MIGAAMPLNIIEQATEIGAMRIFFPVIPWWTATMQEPAALVQPSDVSTDFTTRGRCPIKGSGSFNAGAVLPFSDSPGAKRGLPAIRPCVHDDFKWRLVRAVETMSLNTIEQATRIGCIRDREQRPWL